MERLSDTAIEIINELHTERLDYSSEYIPLIDATNRLAAYEDTGLDPEEIRWLGDLRTMKREIIFGVTAERLKELAEADKAGRLVVLPCKVGATVYGHSKAEVSEYEVAVISLATYNWYLRCQNHNSDFWVTDADIGKTVFLTREEAEAALKGGEG